MKNLYLILSIFFALVPIISFAQQFTHYDVSDGLAHQQVTAFYQDSKGYLWIGTWNGLNRFDGHTFTTYRHDPGDSTTIFGGAVRQITEDSTGTIWIVNRDGPAKFNTLHDCFQRVYLKKNQKIKYDGITDNSLAFDHKNQGWFLEKDGLIGFNEELTQIKHYDLSSFHNTITRGGVIADSGGLWIATIQGLFHFTFDVLEKTQKLEVGFIDQAFPFIDIYPKSFAGNILRTADGNMKINVDTRYLFVSNSELGKMQKIPLPLHNGGYPFKRYDDLIELAPGKIGFCTHNSGIQILNTKTNSFEFGYPLQQIVGEQKVNSLYKDRQQNYWVGTQNGLIKYSIPQLDYDKWLYEPGTKNSLSGRFVSSIFRDNSNLLWVACKGGGLDCIDLRTGSIKNIRIDDIAEQGGDLSNARFVYGMDKENLLIGLDTLFFAFNKKNNRVNWIINMPHLVFKIYQDHKKNLWIGNGHKTYLTSYDNNELTFIDSLFHKNHCRDIIVTRNDELYFATRKGLIKLDSSAPGLLKTFLPPGSEMDPEILCIHENSDGTLWTGSIRNGIYLFDPEQEKFIKQLNTESGLIDNSVNAFMEDDHGNLWLSTWKGIVRFDPVNETFGNFGKVHGIPVWDFTTGAYLWDDSGRIIFGGMGGVVRFHPDSLVRFKPEYELQIVGLYANNQRLPLKYPVGNDEMVTLEYDQHDFSLEFSSFDFRQPDQRIYRYRLNGYDTDWKNAKSNDQTARYSGITSGLYSFELQSTYNGWPWIGEQTRLMVRVKPPPVFQRKSFQNGILLALGISIIAIVFLRIRYINIRKEVLISRLEKDANQSKLNFLKSQMNPHFYFNTLNAINSFVLKHEIREANRFLTTFARLMRQILENSQKEFVTIAEEKDVLEKYLSLQQLRFPEVFDYSVSVDESVLDKNIPPMFLQPFVENSVEYAFLEMKEKGFVKVEFRNSGDGIICAVKDNGIGIEKSQQIKKRANRKSTAIRNIYKRIEMLNIIYNLSITLEITPLDETKKDCPGTSIKLLLPDFGKLIDEK